MRTFLVCLLVVALLGFAFSEPAVEKRSWLKKTFRKVKDAYKGSDLQSKLKDVGNTLLKTGKDLALKGLDKVQDAAVKKATGF
ncbi:hypothetical protein RRG08_018603 [Elysia crispata]|uniref:Uncharacterized protein n=1 Tax=Elysia crispata TaxID=231223 RepID=A0AAE0YK64_9GAST|nr:hypothetical protein RRG08_018603 [Elysia crispata]